MKHLAILSLCTLNSSLLTLFAAEVTVYPNTAQNVVGKPLMIATYVSGETADRPQKWAFAGATFATRTVWNVPVETNTVLEAWIDMDGNGEYDVGEPYGTNAGRDYPEIKLSDISPITPRIDLVDDKSDRPTTFSNRLDEASKRGDPLHPWWNVNVIEKSAVEKSSLVGQRVRVVRWLVNHLPVYLAGCDARVLLDKRIKTDIKTSLTEAGFINGANDVFDLDWEHLRTEVAENFAVRAALAGEELTSVTYLIVVGEGAVEWESSQDTTVVKALDQVIVRRFGESRIKPEPLGPVVRRGKVTLSWKVDCPDLIAYTAFRAKIYSGETDVHDTGLVRMPAMWPDGTYKWTIPAPLSSGTYGWKVAAYNSKFSNEVESAYTNGVPFTVQGN